MADSGKPTHIRYWILFLLFVVSTISYADRSVLSIAGKSVQDSLHITKVDLAWIFSAFGWSYAFAQIPGGFLLDRFGAKLTYAAALILWSLFTLLHGFAGFFIGSAAVLFMFAARFLVGLVSAPGVPANARIVANWFPTSERGTASAIFNATQYFAPFAFNWVLAFIVTHHGWQASFYFMGGIGLVAAAAFWRFVHGPTRHPAINRAEFDHIEKNGALVNIEDKGAPSSAAFTWSNVQQVLANRMFIGIYLGQYCINVLTYFFITWFPLYLVEERHMPLMLAAQWSGQAALVGFAGGVLGGIVSDWLLKRTGSVTFARKTPLLVGMLLATLIIGCNYTDSQALMLVFKLEQPAEAEELMVMRDIALARPDAGVHVLRLFRQGLRGAGLGGGVRHLAQATGRRHRRHLQHGRQHRRHRDAAGDRLHHPDHPFL